MAKVKKNEEVLEAQPEEAVSESKPKYTEAQLYRMKVLADRAKFEAEKRAEVLAKVKEEAGAYKPELRGLWISHTEKSGKVSPAIIVGERFEGDSLVLALYVFSPDTATPYRVERTF